MKQFISRIPILNILAHWGYRFLRAQRGSYRLKRLKKGSTIKLVVGASNQYEAGWIATDAEYLNLLNQNHWAKYFERDSIDAILAEHVWEHLEIEDARKAASRCYEFIKPGGYLRVAVPDGFHPEQDYIRYVEPGGYREGSDDHKVLYNHITFANIFIQAGFRINLLEYFDSENKYHSVDWDPLDGKINRSRRYDERNQAGDLKYTSIILDAHKPE